MASPLPGLRGTLASTKIKTGNGKRRSERRTTLRQGTQTNAEYGRKNTIDIAWAALDPDFLQLLAARCHLAEREQTSRRHGRISKDTNPKDRNLHAHCTNTGRYHRGPLARRDNKTPPESQCYTPAPREVLPAGFFSRAEGP